MPNMDDSVIIFFHRNNTSFDVNRLSVPNTIKQNAGAVGSRGWAIIAYAYSERRFS